jgi:hypothetical protein
MVNSINVPPAVENAIVLIIACFASIGAGLLVVANIAGDFSMSTQILLNTVGVAFETIAFGIGAVWSKAVNVFQEYFSKLVGTYDKIRPSQTYNKNAYGTPSGSSTSFADDNEKRIIKPEEFATLQDIILLYPLPLNFCRVQKQFHYTKNKTA